MKKRFATTLILVILSLIAVYGVSYVALGRILHPVFYRVSERVQKIPGAAEGFVPQGGLCGARHKLPYAEIDVMPTKAA